jgi:acyl transferase domain-containing protein/acyl carrier protein
MGIFTGQGAQWAGMGKDLIERSSYAREIIGTLDDHLSSLPEADRPSWKILEELSISPSLSRLGEAEIAQPLTAALQMLLVDLLRVAGVRLNSVVGHSSGEIAAAYAAGLITAKDAIRVAYYRGLHSSHASAVDGKPGAMVATALTAEQAIQFCNSSVLEGRVVPAAFTGPGFVTLSGDADIIDRAILMLDTQNIRATKLKVDKAYHSFHMLPCVDPYRRSLSQCQAGRTRPSRQSKDSPIWFSSVYPGERFDADKGPDLSYWADNLLSPVQFSEAITTALPEMGTPDICLELGPGATLKSPISRILSDAGTNGKPYIGLLNRGSDSLITISEALGQLWTRLGRNAVNFAQYDQTYWNAPQPKLLKDLPTYPWQHDKEYWWQNRLLRRRTKNKHAPSELLGEEMSMGAKHQAQWRRFLRSKNIPWLLDHKIDCIPIFPGAAYVSMAVSASQRIFDGQAIELIEVEDVQFKGPITFPGHASDVEITFTVKNIRSTSKLGQADFIADFCSDQHQNELTTAALGRLSVHFGTDNDRAYPQSMKRCAMLTDVDPSLFYATLSRQGYGYTGPFRAITKLCRRLDFSTGIIAIPPSEMTFHPALLDALLQSTFAAECYAGDSAIFDMRVPSRIRSIKVFPARFSELSTLNSTDVKFDTVKTGNYEYDGLLYATPGIGAIIQMEGLRTSPLRLPTPEDDLKMFSNIVWRPYLRDARALAPDCTVAAQDPAHTVAVERVSFFILRTLNETISPDEEQQAEEPLKCLLQFARFVVNEVTLGLRPHIAPAWVKDTDEDIAKILSDNRHMADMLLLEALRMAYPRIIRGEVAILSVLTDDDRLAKLYANGPGFHEANMALSNVVSRITCGAQGIRILEVGAGTGGATGGILASATYSSYTYTDVSPAFFARAKEKFAEFTDKIAFSLLDLEKEFAAQGYEPGSFEVIVASNVLHALDNLPTALAQLRQLLKPGGYLACIELPTSSLIGTAVIFGGLPGWGAGKRAGRSSWSPALTDQQWDVELKNAGFTGLDCITPIEDELRIFYRVFVSQALDSRITTLRDPFKTDLPLATENIMIIGDHAASHGSYVDAVGRLLSCSFREIVRLPRLEDLRPDASVPRAVLCLTDLEEPVFGNMTEVKWSAFRKLLTEATDILWVTKGCKYPTKTKAIYSHMMTGLVRSVRHEIRDLRFRMLDIDDTNTVPAKRVAQVMLEWSLLGVFTAGGWRDEVLFPHDTELAIGNGALWVQRPELARSESDRYNSQRRLIVEEVAPHETPIELARSPTAQGYDIRATLQNAITGQGSQFVSVKMIYSTVYAIKVKSIGFAFIGVGVTGDNKRAVVLSRRLSSVVVVQKDELYPLPRSEDLTPELVQTIAADIVAEHIVASAWARGKILVLASDALSVSSIRRIANEHHIEVVFVTGDPDFQAPDAVFIHQNALDIHVRQSLPDDICLFANFSNHASDVALFERVTSILYTANGKVKGFNSFFRGRAYGYDALRREHKATAETAKHLKGPWNTTFSGDGDSNPETLSAVAVAQNGPRDAFTILDWTASNRVSIRVQPATDAVKFAANKTYMIIGSSDLATSLGEWMINSGARHIVMGSRDPSRAAGWAHDMRSKGAYVDLQPVDVTDTDFVKSFFNTIRSQPNKQGTVAPPISGVIHLGLGLKDTVFANMTLDDFHRATDVKTKGSLNLHSHLLEEKLDFFILTSSISYIVGNPGQANYNAGNAFMTGLAHYRRNIGLPASVVHLGPVIGIGYFSREFSQPETGDTLRKLGLYPLSERDLQHIYAEAILASPVDSGRHPEIICGLREIEPDVVDKGLLGKESRAAHLLTRGVASGANLSEESKGQFFVHESVGGMLPSYDQQHSSSATAATSSAPKNLSARDSALRPVIQKALMDRLSALIQMDAKDIDPGASLLVLGIDSLVASEIGTWMKKEFKVQVPQSVIFGGANLNRIVEFVAEKLEEGKADGGEEGK